MDIEKVVEQKFGEIVSSGFIEEQVKKHLEATITSTVSDCLRSYSDFGKSLGNSLKEALGLGEMRFDLPSYNQLVLAWVKEIVNRSIIEVGKAQIEERLEEFFKPLKKSEWKISEIIDKFTEGMEEDGESGEITFIREESSATSGYVYYYFDKEYGTSKHICGYCISVDEEKRIWNVRIDGDDSEKMKAPVLYGFDAFMFQLFATKARVIDDSDSVCTSYGYDR